MTEDSPLLLQYLQNMQTDIVALKTAVAALSNEVSALKNSVEANGKPGSALKQWGGTSVIAGVIIGIVEGIKTVLGK